MTPHDETQLEGHAAPGQPGAEEPSPTAEQEAAEQPLPRESAPPEEEADEALDPLEAAEAKAAGYLALAQRTQADFENFRRRTTRDAAIAGDRGISKLAKELLPSLDHLELALRSAEEHGGEEFAKGIRLVQNELIGALARVGIQPFSPQGEPFDPAEHEAMASQPIEGTEPGTVAEVYQQGYRLNGAVLRPARVVVAA